MNKRLLSQLILERVSGLRSLRNLGVFFFRGDFEWIVRGMVFYYTPKGLYVAEFRTPLFDHSGTHLPYESQLLERNGFIGKGEMSEEAIVDFVISSPEARNVFASDKSAELPDFVRHVESKPGGLKTPRSRLNHASALILLGQELRAASLLDEIAPLLSPLDVAAVAHCDQLRVSLRQEPEAARAVLEQVRKKNWGRWAWPRGGAVNKRLLSRLMHERVSGLRSWKGFFFRGDFGWVLRGVFFNYAPDGLYIHDFRFPLFDPSDPHLTYSDKLRERAGYIGKGEMSEEEIVDFVMSSPEAQRAFASDKPTELPDFVRNIESEPRGLGNPCVLLVYASALILLGQESRAAGLLDELAATLERYVAECNQLDRNQLRKPLRQLNDGELVILPPLGSERDLAKCNRLRESLRQGSEAARAFLEQIRRENLQKLGIAS